MARPRLVISRVRFDPEAISSALKISSEQVVAALRDGRGAWPFSEYWGERLYEFIKHGNSNQPMSDGAIALAQLRDVTISIKALTRSGIKFQQSKDVGSGRGTDQAGLIASLEACERVVIVDITEFPEVSFLPVDGTRLVSAAHKGDLTTKGWTKARVHAWIEATYAVSVADLTI